MTFQSIKLALLYTAIVFVCWVASFFGLFWMAWCFATGRERGWLIAKGFDRVGNALTGGSDTEYLSARANQARRDGKKWGCLVCTGLDLIQQDHCKLFNPPGDTD